MLANWVLKNRIVIGIVAIILFFVFPFVLYLAIKGVIPIYFATIAVLGLLVLFLYRKHLKSLKNREIVKCSNCGREMTYEHFQRYGCRKCHSDLFIRTGKYAK